MADTHPSHMGSGEPKHNGNSGLGKPRLGKSRLSTARLQGLWRIVTHLPRRGGHYLIRLYQLTFSAFIGRQCRYLPTCSSYMDEAINRHGLYAGTMVGIARICRCHPLGNYGFDPVPQHLPPDSSWLRPWTYGDWQGPLHCEEIFAQNEADPHNPDADQS